MISPAPYLREKIFALLNNAVSYASANVPVYEGEGKRSDKVQIIIGDYSDASAGTKQNFGSQSRQVIQIISEQPTVTRKTVDLIGEQVMQIISANPQEDALDGADFDVNIQGKPDISHLTEDAGSGAKIVRLILSYNLLITNKN